MSTYSWRLVETVATVDAGDDFEFRQVLYRFFPRPCSVMCRKVISIVFLFLRYLIHCMKLLSFTFRFCRHRLKRDLCFQAEFTILCRHCGHIRLSDAFLGMCLE